MRNGRKGDGSRRLQLCTHYVWIARRRMNSNTCNCRLEQAAEDPSALTQETIIEKLDPVEAARLDKVRNIGIAV